MHMTYDADEYQTVYETHDHGPHGMSCSVKQVRRPKEEVLAIKEARRQREEEEILRKADAIRARRGMVA